MRITVRLFARLREELGADSLELTFEQDPTLADVLDRVLGDRRPRSMLIAINNELLRERDPRAVRLKDGDVVDLMPPASGG